MSAIEAVAGVKDFVEFARAMEAFTLQGCGSLGAVLRGIKFGQLKIHNKSGLLIGDVEGSYEVDLEVSHDKPLHSMLTQFGLKVIAGGGVDGSFRYLVQIDVSGYPGLAGVFKALTEEGEKVSAFSKVLTEHVRTQLETAPRALALKEEQAVLRRQLCALEVQLSALISEFEGERKLELKEMQQKHSKNLEAWLSGATLN